MAENALYGLPGANGQRIGGTIANAATQSQADMIRALEAGRHNDILREQQDPLRQAAADDARLFGATMASNGGDIHHATEVVRAQQQFRQRPAATQGGSLIPSAVGGSAMPLAIAANNATGPVAVRSLLGRLAYPRHPGTPVGAATPRVPIQQFIAQALTHGEIAPQLQRHLPDIIESAQQQYAMPGANAADPSFEQWWGANTPAMAMNDTESDRVREQLAGAMRRAGVQTPWSRNSWSNVPTDWLSGTIVPSAIGSLAADMGMPSVNNYIGRGNLWGPRGSTSYRPPDWVSVINQLRARNANPVPPPR